MSEGEKESPNTTSEAVSAEKILTTRQAADFMGLSPQRLNRLRRRGEIPAKRSGWHDWTFKEADLMAYVERAAGVQGTEPATPAASDAPAMQKQSLSDMTKLISEMGPSVKAAQTPQPLAEEAPLVRMANAILVNCLQCDASDMHFEPDRLNVRIRVRTDGVMQQIMTLPKYLQFPLMNRYKVMADINPFRSLVPQIGSIPIKHGERDYNLRVSTVPSLYGESIVIHVLDLAGASRGLPRLGFQSLDQARLEELSTSSGGLLLFAGPPGSGITTTAYTVLYKLNSVTHKMCSFEEVPEYRLGGIDQTYRHRSPISVADGVRALLRHNADVLFLGDIRDEELARCAVEAAQSGVLVLATISALDSIDALRRLESFGVSKGDVAQAVIGVVGQRLVRKTCVDCKEEYTVPAYELLRFGLKPDSVDQQVSLYRGAGCENCRNRGYRGRIGLFEVLRMNDEIAELLRRDALRSDLKDAAQATGMHSLVVDGLHKFLQGLTTPDEVNRALGTLLRT